MACLVWNDSIGLEWFAWALCGPFGLLACPAYTRTESIIKIPISQSGSPDKLVWHFESKGRYTVKSVLAIHSVCHLASCRGWYHAIVKSDSQLAIYLSYTETVPPWSIAALVDDIRLWSKNMDLSFSWTSRDNNQLAHYVARLASSSTFHFSWDASFPHELTSLARCDMYCS
ncbi:reverse transcriptase [Tanacetum coccineum]